MPRRRRSVEDGLAVFRYPWQFLVERRIGLLDRRNVRLATAVRPAHTPTVCSDRFSITRAGYEAVGQREVSAWGPRLLPERSSPCPKAAGHCMASARSFHLTF